MKYISVLQASKKWKLSERSVRNYCSLGRVPGALINGKTWQIPYNASKPKRIIKHLNKKINLLETLKIEKENKINGGIYHKLQIEMTYNSNHIEGSKLTFDQTRYIFETKTIGVESKTLFIDDILETVNHFRCIDLAIDSAKSKLTESLIKQFHYLFKSSTSDSNKGWFKVGEYKTMPNEVGGINTTSPENVKEELKKLIDSYNSINNVTIDDIIEFHYKFECIHPFKDGNGRVGRLIMFKECLKHNLVPILISDEYKAFYYRGLKEFKNQPNYLKETCLNGQDIVKEYLDYFKINY